MDMPEARLKAEVLKIARRERWLTHHMTNSWNARGAQKGSGFPDLVMARGSRLLLVELKREKAQLEPLQVIWRETLERNPGIEYCLWRPSDLIGGIVEERLT